MESITLTINGREVTAEPGSTILDTVRKYELDDIPTLCHSDDLKPYASCFLCVVEIKGRPTLAPSCSTPVAPGMEVVTRNDRIIESRKTALELLLSNHYADCLSPCKLGCPAGVDAQGYIALSAMGESVRAVDLIRETNPLPAVCGRVCVRKCELQCRRNLVDTPVAINNIKRYVTDAPGIYDADPVCEPPTDKKVAVIGSGPSGLTAAWFLGKKGHKTVIFESQKKPGGMLRYGIPEYRLPDEVLDKEIDYIKRTGCEIRTGVHVGRDISMADLRKEFDAVYIAVGAWAGNKMRVEGEEETEGVVKGSDWLVEMADSRKSLSGTVVVVGGGNTAMDAARTSVRLGADKVIILYRRTKKEMPADQMEVEACGHEGIEIMELAAPIGIISDDRRLKALRCIRMSLGEPDASGRRRPIPIEGSEFELPCNLAISAIGQSPVVDDLLEGLESEQPEVSRWNTFEINTDSMATNVPGVFAGGDCADDGPTVVIDAIADGGKAAESIHAYIMGEQSPRKPFYVEKKFWSEPGMAEIEGVSESPRHELHELPPAERTGNFREVATGYDYEDNVHECSRCLSCGCLRFDDCDLRLYAEEYEVDMELYKGQVRKHRVVDDHPYLVYDPNKCILCARCIRTCDRILPIPALGLVGRGFRTEMRPSMNDPLAETNCVACGNCIDACPTGALTPKYPYPGRAALPHEDVETSCGFCSVGCPVTVKKVSDNQYNIVSSPVAGEYICRYGRFGSELFMKSSRLFSPMERSGPELKDIGWDDAIEKVATSFRRAIEEHGPSSVAVIVSPELSNEELYLAQQLARKGLGTNNIGSISVLETFNKSGALDECLGFTGSTADRSVLKDAELIVCSNTDTLNENLILSVDIVDAVKEREASLITVNSTVDPLDSLAKMSVNPFRGRAAIMWEGVVRHLVESGAVSEKTVRTISGGKEYLDYIFERDMATVSGFCGVEEERIAALADSIIRRKRVVFVLSPDRQRDRAPVDGETMANLVIILRAAGIEADLLLPMISANGAGMEICGADPAFSPGKEEPADLPGAKNREGLRRLLEDGGIKAALIIGEDPMRNDRTASYFYNMDFCSAIDWAATETTSFADIALPGSTYLESDGTRINFEGKVTTFVKAVDPPAGKTNTEILWMLLNAMGVKTGDETVAGITKEIRKAVEKGTGEFGQFYWSEGERPRWDGKGYLVVPEGYAKAAPIPQPVTVIEHYKKTSREVGIEHFRVQ